jgi:tetratricopeptide (TPR) repeat protein
MGAKTTRGISLAALGIAILALGAWGVSSRTASSRLAGTGVPPATTLPSDRATAEHTIRFLEDRVQRDPEDFIAHNKLAGYYLQLVRETSDLTYLNLAARAARASLATLPPEQNTGGLTALAQVEFTSHEFAAARDHAQRLTELDPGKAYAYQFLGDALLELGDYDKAKEAFGEMVRLGGIHGLTRVAIEQRMARLAALRGDMATARQRFLAALKLALELPAPPRETVAWCRWQLGETAFATGDYAAAEQHYRDALTTFPGYVRAMASLGQVLAARGDPAGAIQQYESAVRVLPDLAFVAALGDLYRLTGREKDAAAQYALVETIAKVSAASGGLFNRQQVLFYADHDIKPEEAYENATQEYAVRRDIYGADAVAWTALKAGRLAEAQGAIKEALRLGTADAKLFYHAGMIARAAGDKASARQFLTRALTLSPQFDPLQASIARRVLATCGEGQGETYAAR